MKTPSNEIFQLVKSLDSHEKAFIKLCLHKELKTSINEGLFDYLSSMTEYDENKLLLEFKEINKNTIKHCKQTIFDFILKSLELYYANSTIEQKLYHRLFHIRILRKKKLFSKVGKIINFSIEKAARTGHFLIQLQFMAEQQLIAIESDNIEEYEQLQSKNSVAKEALMKSYSDAQQNQEKIYLLQKLNIKGGCYPENEKHQIIKNIYADLIAKNGTDSFRDRDTFIILQNKFIEYYCLLLLNEYANANACFQNYLSLYESFNEIIDNPEEYLWHINVGITISNFSGDPVLLWKMDEKAENLLRILPVKYQSTAVQTNYFTVKNSVIAFLTHVEDFREACIRSENIQAEILSNNVKPSIRKIFLANFCQIYLCNGEIRKALHCYNTLNNNIEYYTVRNDIDPGMSILGLAIFHELDSLENMTSLVRACKRKNDINPQCKIYYHLLDFFLETIKTDEKQKILSLFEDILQKISSIDNHDSESVFFLKNTLIGAWLRKKRDELY